MRSGSVFKGRLRIAHIQPFTMDLYGHKDEEWGNKIKYFLTHIVAAQARQNDLPIVHLFTSGARKQFEIDGVRVRFHRCWQLPARLPLTARYGRQISLEMVRSISRDEIDVIHFTGAGSLHIMLGAVAWMANQAKIPLFSQDQGPRRGRWIEEKLRCYGVRHTAAFMAPSLDAKQEYENMGVPAERVYLVPNGFDPKLFYPPETVFSNDTEWQTQDRPFRILVVSRLWEDKDPLTMAEAVCQLVRGGMRVELTIVGEGVLHTQVAARLRQDAVPASFLEHIAQEELAEYYRSSDCMLLTSLGEGWNCASVEAMACGLPIVASNVRGVREAVSDAGILVPGREPKLLADALRQVAYYPDAAMGLRRKGIERAREFTWDAVVSKMREIYLSHM